VSAITPLRLLALALALAGVLALSAPAPAVAAKSCLERILEDWYPDESIDKRYSQACYREAEKDLPQDLRDYSDLPGEIQRARTRDLRADRTSPGNAGDDERRLQSSGPVDARNNSGGGTGGRDTDGPIDSLLEAAGPSSADSAPIPLLVLAGLALLLIAAGATGLLTRKLHARRARTAPPVTPDV
jgi:hypothetical protein